ncbi:MAG TPA: PAS domain S-box protein [Chthoniobacteraceae bacterium]|nr:PAS domain S-box protein [Chthoniobacteraceae bacterium]
MKTSQQAGETHKVDDLHAASGSFRPSLSGELLRKILDSMFAFVGLLSTDGIILEVNSAPLAVANLERQDVLGHLFAETYWWSHSTEMRAKVRDAIRRAAAGETVRGDFSVLTTNRQTLVFDTTFGPLRDGEGRVTEVVVSGVDITAHTEAEESLQRLARQNEMILNTAGEGIWGLDADGRNTFLNPAASRMLGYTAEELEGLNTHSILHHTRANGEHYAWEECPIRRSLLDGEQRYCDEDVLWRRDGSSFPAQYVCNPMIVEGKVAGVVVVFSDITSRKAAEEALREHAELLDLATDAISVRDLDGRIQYWNRGAESIYGWNAAEAIGRIASEMLFSEPSQHDAAKREVMETGKWNGEARQQHKNGTVVIVTSRWTLLRFDDGKPKSILVLSTDITEHKRLEAQFLRAQRLDSIGTLASGVAHDLNNILAPILMSAPILKGNPPPSLRDRIIDTIEHSAQRGAAIVQQVLTFARGAEGARLLVQPLHLIKEMANIISETFPKSITVRIRFSNDVWPVEGDPTQLHQVLLNLCVNARDAMPDGGEIIIAAENMMVDGHFAAMAPGAKPGAYVLIEARDTGGGIAPAVMEKIFDPFFTTKETGKGTGLGLSTVIGIVKSHGGFITVESEIGRGSSFKIFLPASTKAHHEIPAQDEEPAPQGNGELVLVVDDEECILDMTRSILELNGYQVVTALDGAEALATFARHMEKIKVVVTNLTMPLLDGIGFIRILRKMKPEVTILASTGQGSDERMHELQTLKIAACLTKPYHARKLLAALHDALAAAAPGHP